MYQPGQVYVRLVVSENEEPPMIRKLSTGKYRLYSLRRDPKTGRRRNLGTFATRADAEKHEREIAFFKHRPSR